MHLAFMEQQQPTLSQAGVMESTLILAVLAVLYEAGVTPESKWSSKESWKLFSLL